MNLFLSESALRLGVFVGLFLLFAALEALAPRRVPSFSRRKRWPTHFAITFLNTVTLRLLSIALPFLAVGAAADASALGVGLFNMVSFPVWQETLAAIVLLDLAIWAQHLVSHKVPLFWRFHRMHHADPDLDVSTAIRFHPIEIAASMVLKIGLVYLLGPSVWAVIIFEILLNGTALFNHANLRLPLRLDAGLRLLLVTPDMHRVHHSVDRTEHDSNYGFALSIWDRLFGTYSAQPKAGHDGMEIGLQWQDDRPTGLLWSLKLPFLRSKRG